MYEPGRSTGHLVELLINPSTLAAAVLLVALPTNELAVVPFQKVIRVAIGKATQAEFAFSGGDIVAKDACELSATSCWLHDLCG